MNRDKLIEILQSEPAELEGCATYVADLIIDQLVDKPEQLSADVLVRAWEPDLNREGARFKATTVRRDITIQTAMTPSEEDPFPEPQTITRAGIVVIGPSAGPGGNNPIDVIVRAIPDRIKFTILPTPELVWLPVNAHRDALMNWHIEAIPYTEWIRLRLGTREPEVSAAQDGR